MDGNSSNIILITIEQQNALKQNVEKVNVLTIIHKKKREQ